jgi:phosphoserine phosphatase
MHPIPYSPGFRDFIAHVTGKIKTGLLTGGLDITARKVQEECGLDFCLCNELVQKKGIYTGECNLKVHLWKKLELFQDFLKENNFSPENVCYVGDTKGDIACMNYAGLGVAHNPKDEETKKAIPKERTTENHMELVEIIELFEEK